MGPARESEPRAFTNGGKAYGPWSFPGRKMYKIESNVDNFLLVFLHETVQVWIFCAANFTLES